MKVFKHAIGVGVAAALALMAGPSRADWALSSNMAVVRAAPTSLAVQAQNPPSFTWAKYRNAPGYIVEVSAGSTVYATYTTSRNFYLPSRRFPNNTYTWRVRPTHVVDWSTPRSFVINASSTVFEVPENDALRATVLSRPHPRSVEQGFLMASNWSPELRAKRGPALTKLTTDVLKQVTTYTIPADSQWPVTSSTPSAARQAYLGTITNVIGQNVRQLESAALLYRLTKESRYFDEALRRGDALAALDPNGMTSYVNHDIVHRQIIISLVKAMDLIDGDLDATRRAKWQAVIKTRVTPMYNDLISNNFRLDELPYDSHGGTALLYLATVSALTLGDFPEASAWFDATVRAYINSVNPWSGNEGGYANGGAYAMYSTDFFIQLWQPLARATGVDLFKKPWTVGFANMIAEFMPPGATGLVFGDQHESYLYTPQLKSFMGRIATPAAAWYVRNTIGDEPPLHLLQAPYPLPVDTVAAPAPPPNAIVLPSTGWVAMHSNLADRGRTSVYFKSSPYGSYNHSHGDQNSLVIDSGGRRMLIEAGYQDYYASPLGISWYRQTKAHNAITFDGGVGQITTDNVNNLLRNGKITAFSATPTVDYAQGDAVPAYGGALTTATRSVWYLRNSDTVVVLDKLASPTARKFEWNLHTRAPIVAESASALKVTNVDRSLCISSLSTDGTTYKPLTGPANPNYAEYHGAWVKGTAATSAEFLVVLDVGCKRPPVSLRRSTSGRTLVVGTTSIVLPQ
ncbi:DUF4962 domain-containing protein [Pseudoduganella plicata]|uniref:Oligo alginate lyase n=2 Tax=Pseudoduganella plicata TaxID=321984 RepID=A0AA87YBM1_9BURK|nr:DUF4962 domain-containing protein [Pseudoduganella plicata]GGY85043.1 oligo alginate lyase [Pseudoduganella plicata]